MAVKRIRRTDTRREYDSVVDDFVTQGYSVTETGEATTLLRKNTWGTLGWHIIIFIFLGWWTIFVANIAYALIAHFAAEQVFVRLELPGEQSPKEEALEPPE